MEYIKNMNLYSHNSKYPTPLPFRIRISEGFTRTNPNTFTEDEIISAGYTGPYIKPEYDSKKEVLDWDGTQFYIRPHNSQELEEQWNSIRMQRNKLLKDSDWTQIGDYDINILNKDEWEVYRQNLRDIPKNNHNPFDVKWPTTPTNYGK